MVLVIVTSMYTLFSKDKVPSSGITAVQLLWVNLIMDTLAALALATDPPSESLLDRKPAKRSENILSFCMIKMILGQAVFQIVVCLVIYFLGPDWFPDVRSRKDEINFQSALMFNTFVFCQIFNEINARSITNSKQHQIIFWNLY